MNRFFVNQLVIAALIVSAAFVTSCKKDDVTATSGAFNGVITAQVENGTHYNDLVKRVAVLGGRQDVFVVGTGVYENGGFTITFPQEPPANVLISIFEERELPNGISTSDKNVKLLNATEGGIKAYSSTVGEFNDEDRVGVFFCVKISNNSTSEMHVMYADRDVIIKGTSKNTDDDVTYILEYNVNYKKGWNKSYITFRETQKGDKREMYTEVTTNPISDLKWIFDSYSQ